MVLLRTQGKTQLLVAATDLNKAPFVRMNIFKTQLHRFKYALRPVFESADLAWQSSPSARQLPGHCAQPGLPVLVILVRPAGGDSTHHGSVQRLAALSIAPSSLATQRCCMDLGACRCEVRHGLAGVQLGVLVGHRGWLRT
jgi:hypothetical protein